MEFDDDDEDVETYSITEEIDKLLAHARKRRPKGVAPTAFLHHDPRCRVMYGGWLGDARAPVAFLEAPSQELTAYLCGDPLGPFRSPYELEREGVRDRWAFRMDRLEGLLKADWHTVPHLGPEAEIFLPRLGRAGQLIRAPPRILAFMVAFRVVNSAAWTAIAKVLRGLGQAREADRGERARTRGKVLRSLAECFVNQRHFGAVEAQVWWGGEAKRLPSHKDGAPSLLHLGVTLSGRRTLRAGVFRGCNAEGNRTSHQLLAAPAQAGMPWTAGLPLEASLLPTANMQSLSPIVGSMGGPIMKDPTGFSEKNVWDEDLWRKEHLREVRMAPGSVYLSSPYCFEHAVCYEACSEHEPVIALQCRFGFPDDLGARLNELRDQAMLEAATVVTEALGAASAGGLLRMPTAHEVARAEAELKGAVPHT